jgi:hypothetical protein
MSISQPHQHQLARPIQNRFRRQRSRFVSSQKNGAEQRKLSFQQTGAIDTNTARVQTKGVFWLLNRFIRPSS